MTILRDTSQHSRSHYARLLVTPLPSLISPTAAAIPIDRIALLSLAHKALGEWFGPAGGVSGVEVEVLSVQEPSGTSVDEPAAREAILRLPAASAHLPLTALPLTPASYEGQAYSLQVLASSDELAKLGGQRGRGASGWKGWREGLKSG